LQSLWTTIKEHRFFYYTIENPDGQSFFAMHSTPILILLLPIYAIYPYPETLLILQSFILASGALPLYLIAYNELGDKRTSLLVSASYLLYPALHGVNQYDFHTESFLPFLFLSAFHYYKSKRWLHCILFFIFSLFCIEFVPFIVVSFSIYHFLRILIFKLRNKNSFFISKKEFLFGIAILILSAVFFLINAWILSTFNPSQNSIQLLVSRLSSKRIEGNSFNEILLKVFFHTEETLLALLSDWPNKFNYLLYLFAPLMFIPIFDPLSFILMMPWIGAAFITTWGAYYSIYYQYSSFIIPFVFIAYVNGIKRISNEPFKIGNEAMKKIAVGVLVCTLFFSFYLSVLSPINPMNGNPYDPFISNWWPEITRHHHFINEAISLIPPNSSVLTQVEIIPHLSNRLSIFEFLSDTSPRPDFILIDPFLESYKLLYVGGFPGTTFFAHDLIRNQKYGLYAIIDGVLLYMKEYEGPIKFYVPQSAVFNYKHFYISNGKITRDETSRFGRVIASNPYNSMGIIWFGPYKYFIPGRYVATFRLKLQSETGRLLIDIVTNKGKSYIGLRTIYGSDFKERGAWQDFSLYFEIDEITELEFRGICLTNNTQIYLDFIRVEMVEVAIDKLRY
jgi:uncharacterized membrane protein